MIPTIRHRCVSSNSIVSSCLSMGSVSAVATVSTTTGIVASTVASIATIASVVATYTVTMACIVTWSLGIDIIRILRRHDSRSINVRAHCLDGHSWRVNACGRACITWWCYRGSSEDISQFLFFEVSSLRFCHLCDVNRWRCFNTLELQSLHFALVNRYSAQWARGSLVGLLVMFYPALDALGMEEVILIAS